MYKAYQRQTLQVVDHDQEDDNPSMRERVRVLDARRNGRSLGIASPAALTSRASLAICAEWPLWGKWTSHQSDPAVLPRDHTVNMKQTIVSK